jgi:hypothetical protein
MHDSMSHHRRPDDQTEVLVDGVGLASDLDGRVAVDREVVKPGGIGQLAGVGRDDDDGAAPT